MNIYDLKKMSPEDRRLVLESENFKVLEEDYLRPLEEEEMSILKSELAQSMVQKGFIDNEFKEVKAGFKARLKPLEREIGTAIMMLTSRQMNENGKVYMLQDFDNNLMHTVTPDGTVLNSRPLKPEERQTMVMSSLPNSISRAV